MNGSSIRHTSSLFAQSARLKAYFSRNLSFLSLFLSFSLSALLHFKLKPIHSSSCFLPDSIPVFCFGLALFFFSFDRSFHSLPLSSSVLTLHRFVCDLTLPSLPNELTETD
jgi:hypothetical protein